MCNFKKIPLIKNFQRDGERGTHKFLRETIYDTKYIHCFVVTKPLETVMNVTQIFYNCMMTTKKIFLVSSPAGFGLNKGLTGFFKLQSLEARQ